MHTAISYDGGVISPASAIDNAFALQGGYLFWFVYYQSIAMS